MKFCVIIINDGRNDYLEKALKSFSENVIFPEGSEVYKIMLDDWPLDRDIKTLEELAKTYGIDKVIYNDTNLGVNENVRKAWGIVPDDTDYIFHQENDFIYLERINIGDLVAIVETPNIIQCALVRQPWFDDELKAGSLMNTRPERFKSANVSGTPIVVHKDHFTFNPSLYKYKWLVDLFPFGEYELRHYFMALNPGLYFSYYGSKEDSHRVLHIGEKKR